MPDTLFSVESGGGSGVTEVSLGGGARKGSGGGARSEDGARSEGAGLNGCSGAAYFAELERILTSHASLEAWK